MDDDNRQYGTRRQLIKMAGIAGAGIAGMGTASASGESKPVLKRWRCAGVGAKAWDGKGFDKASKVHALFKNKKGKSLKFEFNSTKNLPKTQTKGGVTVELSKANLMIKGNRMRKGYALKRVWTPETGSKNNPKFGKCFKPDPDQKPVLKRWRCAGVGAKAWDGKGFDKASKVHALFKNKHGKPLKFEFNSTKNLPKTQTKDGVTVELSKANLMIKGNRMRKGYALKRVWTPETGSKNNPKFGECHESKPGHGRPECEIEFHNKCKRVTVKCDKKVKVKAYTKYEHKWGGKVIEKETKTFDWTLQKEGNYFTKVEVYYKGELIAKRHCDRKHEPDKPKCDIKFHKNCKRVRVECDKKVKVKAYTKKEHKWGGKVIEKETKTFDWTLQKKGNYFTKVEVYYKGERIAKKHCDREHKPKKPDYEGPTVKCPSKKKIVVKNVPKWAKGHITFVYKTRGGKKKYAGISLKWLKPGDTKQKGAITVTRTDTKVVAKTRANWTAYKVKGKVDGKHFSHKCKHGGHDGGGNSGGEFKFRFFGCSQVCVNKTGAKAVIYVERRDKFVYRNITRPSNRGNLPWENIYCREVGRGKKIVGVRYNGTFYENPNRCAENAPQP